MTDTVITLTLESWKAIARIGHAASADQERPVLCGLRLELASEALVAVATDSYCLATTTVEVEVADGDGAWAGLIPARQGLQIEKDVRSLEHYRSKKDRPDDQIFLSVALGESQVVFEIDERGTMFGGDTIARTVDLVDGSYPNWRLLLEDPPGDGSNRVSLTSEILTRVLKTTAAAVVTYEVAEHRKPLRLSAIADPAWAAAVMPAAREEDHS